MTSSDIQLAANLRKWAAQIQVDTIEKAEMVVDLVMAAQRLGAIAKDSKSSHDTGVTPKDTDTSLERAHRSGVVLYGKNET